MRLELLTPNSEIRIYKYDSWKRQFLRVIGGIKELDVNDIFFAACNGNIIKDPNGESLHVLLSKPIIKSEVDINNRPLAMYYDFDAVPNNVCIDMIMNTKYIHKINIMPKDIPNIYKNCDISKPNNRFLRSRKLVGLLKNKRSNAMTTGILNKLCESMNVFIKTN